MQQRYSANVIKHKLGHDHRSIEILEDEIFISQQTQTRKSPKSDPGIYRCSDPAR